MRPLRCPRHPKTKFAEVDGTDGAVEVSCRPCRRALASIGGTRGRVIHRFDLNGRLVETRVYIADVLVDTPGVLVR